MIHAAIFDWDNTLLDSFKQGLQRVGDSLADIMGADAAGYRVIPVCTWPWFKTVDLWEIALKERCIKPLKIASSVADIPCLIKLITNRSTTPLFGRKEG